MYDDDSGAPTVVTIAQRTSTTNRERELQCGHIVQAGTRYDEWVGVVDGEFTVDHDCAFCWQERDDAMYEAEMLAMKQEEYEMNYDDSIRGKYHDSEED